jgi:hypothetical protein
MRPCKEYLGRHRITAKGWCVAHPGLTATEIHRLEPIGETVDAFLDQISS